jgi:hypothetical protein
MQKENGTTIDPTVRSLAWSLWTATAITHSAIWLLTLLVGHSLAVARPNIPLPTLTSLILDYSFLLIAIPIAWLLLLIACEVCKANVGRWRFSLCGMVVAGAAVMAWSLLALVLPWLPHKL